MSKVGRLPHYVMASYYSFMYLLMGAESTPNMQSYLAVNNK